ncbi:MAG: hypothetical protein SGI77_08060, partial [Pirellulaceae bacterium]|nr:hypothetical protein [Pirellulaceae bacterium]
MNRIGVSGTIACIMLGSIATIVITSAPVTVLFAPYTFGPLLVSLLIAYFFRKARSQTTLFISALPQNLWVKIDYLSLRIENRSFNGHPFRIGFL